MKRAIFLSLVMIAGIVAPVRAETTDPAWEKFTSARRVFQMRLAELAAQRWPNYADFFTSHRDLQLAYLERRTLVFYHFAKNQPSRIVRDQGGQAFISFAWEKDEDKEFVKTIPGYATLAARITKLEARARKFRNREALKDRFARLELDPEYLALMRDMGRSIGDAEQELAKSVQSAAPPQLMPKVGKK